MRTINPPKEAPFLTAEFPTVEVEDAGTPLPVIEALLPAPLPEPEAEARREEATELID
jgi:hypothetical protein